MFYEKLIPCAAKLRFCRMMHIRKVNIYYPEDNGKLIKCNIMSNSSSFYPNCSLSKQLLLLLCVFSCLYTLLFIKTFQLPPSITFDMQQTNMHKKILHAPVKNLHTKGWYFYLESQIYQNFKIKKIAFKSVQRLRGNFQADTLHA